MGKGDEKRRWKRWNVDEPRGGSRTSLRARPGAPWWGARASARPRAGAGRRGAHMSKDMIGPQRLGLWGAKQKRCTCDRCGGANPKTGWRQCYHPATIGDLQQRCFSCVRLCTKYCTPVWCEGNEVCNSRPCDCSCVLIREAVSSKGQKRRNAGPIPGDIGPNKYRERD